MNKSAKDYYFVGIQGLLFIIFFIPFFDIRIFDHVFFNVFGWSLFIIGGIISVGSMIQLNTSLSPFPTPRQSGILVTQGFYRWVRNPIYSGLILLFFGLSLIHSSLYQIIISVLLYILFHLKVRYEESQLISKYGKDYQRYMDVTGRFFLKIKL